LCFAIAVLSKETMLIFLPAVAVAQVQNFDRRTRALCLTAFLMALLLIAIGYPLYALLKGELLPGPGHVSLLQAVEFQLYGRPGTGSVLSSASAAHQLVSSWLQTDPWLLGLRRACRVPRGGEVGPLRPDRARHTPARRDHRQRRKGPRMTPQAAPAQLSIADGAHAANRSAPWLPPARHARPLAWASLFWMTHEGVLGVLAGVEANPISVLTWAASAAVEGMASAIVIWRFTGPRNLSGHSEPRPALGRRQLLPPGPVLPIRSRRSAQSRHPARRDGAGAGTTVIDPLAALLIAGIAAKEGLALWRGEECDCHTLPGLDPTSSNACRDDC
jgi:hypothetical protein